MDAPAALTRARELVAAGKRRDAILMLRARVDANPGSIENRRAFAQFYRDLGHPDQAGRWGLLVDDFATDIEREAFVAILRNTDPTEFRVRTLLVLDRDSELSETARWALEEARKPAVERPEVTETVLEKVSDVLLVTAWAYVLLLPLVILVAAVFDAPWIQAAALGGLAIAVALFALFGIIVAADALITRMRRNS